MGTFHFQPRYSLPTWLLSHYTAQEFEEHPEYACYISRVYNPYGRSDSSVSQQSMSLGGSCVLPNCVPQTMGRIREVWGAAIEYNGYLTNQEAMMLYNHGEQFKDGQDYLEKVYGIDKYNDANAKYFIELTQNVGCNEYGQPYRHLDYQIPYLLKETSTKIHGPAESADMDVWAGTDDYQRVGLNLVDNPLCKPIPGAVVCWARGSRTSGGNDMGHVAFIEEVQGDLFRSSHSYHRSIGAVWQMFYFFLWGSSSNNGYHSPYDYPGGKLADYLARTLQPTQAMADWFQGYVYPPIECGLGSYSYRFECEAGQLNRFKIKNRMWV